MPSRKPRTPQETALVERAARVLPGGTLGNVYLPPERAVLIKAGKGSHVWDVSGNEYIDYLLGSGPMVLGHAHPAVVAAASRAVEQGTTFFATNEAIIYLAEEMVKAIPCAEKVRFTASGSEATFYAMRLARAYRKQDKILKFEGGYHGSNDYAMMSVNPKNPPSFPRAAVDSPGIPGCLQAEVLVAPFNDLETTATIIQEHRRELAGVIVEPFQRVIPPKPGFLQGLRKVTQEYEIPLIFDEVVTGFRFAYGGAQEHYGVVPDLASYGKIVGGGFPLAAVAGRDEIMDLLDPGRSEGFVPQVGTLSGNPVAAAAGLATLRELQRPGTYEKLFASGRTLRQGMERLLQEAEIPAQVVGEDPLFDVYFTDTPIVDYRSTLQANGAMLRSLNSLLLERGIFKGSNKFYVSLAHSQQDIQETLGAFKDALSVLNKTR
ncbi:MAG: aspartate aminotransferase family protein [Chloroflexi bacterium]|nr:aspartate aminotransferase family protein [Chloroflexota bacterium]